MVLPDNVVILRVPAVRTRTHRGLHESSGGATSRRAARAHVVGVRKHRGSSDRAAGAEIMGPSRRWGSTSGCRTFELPASRGQILDRRGVPLGITLDARDIYADPSLVTDPVGEAAQIADALDERPKQVLPALEAPGTFAYVARQVDLDVAQRVEDLAPARDRVPLRPQAVLPERRARAGGDRVRGRRRHGARRARSGVQLRAGRGPGRADVRAERGSAHRAGHRPGEGTGRRHQPEDDARPRDAVPGAGGAQGRRRGERREVGNGHRDGRADRRHLRDGELPLVRPEQLRARRRARPRTTAEPRRRPTRSSPARSTR